MLIWLAAALLLALGFLTAARYLDAPGWIYALMGTGGACGLAAALVVGLVMRRYLGTRRWQVWAALVVAVASVVARQSLLAELNRDPMAAVTIQFSRLGLAGSSVVWGALALLWGASTVAQAMEPAPGRPRRGGAVLLGGAASVTLALFSLGPLWALAGLHLNHWTLIGLLGLAGLAYGAGALYRRIFHG